MLLDDVTSNEEFSLYKALLAELKTLKYSEKYTNYLQTRFRRQY